MAGKIEYRDNSEEVLNLLQKAIHRGLEAVGQTAEKHAKKNITEAGAVDTGRLRNSITYVIAGYQTHVQSYRRDNMSGGTTVKHTRTTYSDEKMDGEKDSAVYIGTNVDYGKWVELGTGIYASDGNGRKDPWAYEDEKGEVHWTRGIKPVHYLKRAAEEHRNEYKKLMKDSLENAE